MDAAEAIGTETGLAKQLIQPVEPRQNFPVLYVLMDGVQIPTVAAATEGRIGRTEGQRARTRECKLGAVYTQATADRDGSPIRDPDSTTYVGPARTADEFDLRIYTDAWRRGWEWAVVKVVIGDGAVWFRRGGDETLDGVAHERSAGSRQD